MLGFGQENEQVSKVLRVVCGHIGIRNSVTEFGKEKLCMHFIAAVTPELLHTVSTRDEFALRRNDKNGHYSFRWVSR